MSEPEAMEYEYGSLVIIEPERNLKFQFDMNEFLLRCATFISFCEFYFFHKSVEYDVARSESYF